MRLEERSCYISLCKKSMEGETEPQSEKSERFRLTTFSEFSLHETSLHLHKFGLSIDQSLKKLLGSSTNNFFVSKKKLITQFHSCITRKQEVVLQQTKLRQLLQPSS